MSRSSVFRVGVIAIFVIGIVLVLSACGGDDASLVGSWVNAGDGETFQLTTDGKVVMDGKEGTYKLEGEKLIFTIMEQTVVLDYALDGDSLTLTYEGKSGTYNRVVE